MASASGGGGAQRGAAGPGAAAGPGGGGERLRSADGRDTGPRPLSRSRPRARCRRARAPSDESRHGSPGDDGPGTLCVSPGRGPYSPGTWFWWTRAAVRAPCQPPGADEPRAPHPQLQSHLPVSQWTTGWWLKRAERRRRVLMEDESAPDLRRCPGLWRRPAERRGRSAVSVDAGSSVRSSDGPGRLHPGRLPGPPGAPPAAPEPPLREVVAASSSVRGHCEDGAMGTPSLAEVHRRRLATQRLTSAGLRTGHEVVSLLTCVQAQDAPLAAWSLGLRLREGTTYADVLAEQARDGWVRTHILRPTWHLVAPEDLRWVQRATGSRVEQASAGRYRGLGLDESDDRSDARRPSRPPRRTDPPDPPRAHPRFAARGLAHSGEQMAHQLIVAELRAVICSGPAARHDPHLRPRRRDRAPGAPRRPRRRGRAA